MTIPPTTNKASTSRHQMRQMSDVKIKITPEGTINVARPKNTHKHKKNMIIRTSINNYWELLVFNEFKWLNYFLVNISDNVIGIASRRPHVNHTLEANIP